MGLMGEAGPEAVMPLHRGADGSLASAPLSPDCHKTVTPAPARAAWP